MPEAIDTVREFQLRRKQTWGAAKPWLLLLIASIVVGLVIGDVSENSSEKGWAIFLGMFAAFFISILRLVFIFRAQYRCPACGEVPLSSWASLGPQTFGVERGINLNPSQCSHCGAKLK